MTITASQDLTHLTPQELVNFLEAAESKAIALEHILIQDATNGADMYLLSLENRDIRLARHELVMREIMYFFTQLVFFAIVTSDRKNVPVVF